MVSGFEKTDIMNYDPFRSSFNRKFTQGDGEGLIRSRRVDAITRYYCEKRGEDTGLVVAQMFTLRSSAFCVS